MTQLAQGLGLNLADALAGYLKFAAHFFQRALVAVVQTEAKAQYLFLTGGQGVQHVQQLLLHQGKAGGFRGSGGLIVGDKVAQMAVLLLADWGFQRNGFLGYLDDFPHLAFGNVHGLGNFIRGRLTAVFLQHLTGYANQLVDGFHHMHGNTDGAGLVRDGAGDGLTNPPGGIGGEFVTLAVVKLVHRLNQAQVALLNQVQKQHAAAHIALGDGHHQTQVGFGQLFLGFLVAFLHALGDFNFLLGAQQGNLADFLQVHTHRIVDTDAFGHAQVNLFRLDDFVRHHGVKLVHHVYAHAVQRFVNFVHLVGIDFQIHHLVGNVILGNGALVFGVLV